MQKNGDTDPNIFYVLYVSSIQGHYSMHTTILSSVVDPDHLDSDPDPSFPLYGSVFGSGSLLI